MRRIGTFDLAVVAAISDMPFGVAVSAFEKSGQEPTTTGDESGDGSVML
jgi:methylthioribose-1-phosphate isomerase